MATYYPGKWGEGLVRGLMGFRWQFMANSGKIIKKDDASRPGISLMG
jgi:hypothetical protein